MAKNKLQEYFQKLRLPLPVYSTIKETLEPNLKWISTVSIISPIDFMKYGITTTMHFTGNAYKAKIDAEVDAALKALKWIGVSKDEPKYLYKPPQIQKTPPLFYTGHITPLNTNSDIKTNHNEIYLKEYPSKIPVFIPSYIESAKKEEKSIIKLKKDTVLLVDVENIPKIIGAFLSEKHIFPENFWIYAFVGKHHPQSECISSIKHPRITKVLSPSTQKDATDTYMQMYVGIFLYDETFEEYLICTRDHFGSNLVEFIQSKEPDQPWKPKKANLVSTVDHIKYSLNDIGFE